MDRDQRSVTLSDEARASNPTGLTLEPLTWISYFPKLPVLFSAAQCLFIVLCLKVHWAFALLFLPTMGLNVLYWQRVKEHFLFGDTNPGLVVSLNPMLIAVRTDLTCGAGAYPVIKIIRLPLRTASGKRPEVGTRVAASCLYTRSTDKPLPHWVDFQPVPVDCATRDPHKCDQVLSSISETEWENLRTGLPQVPTPFQPGLYRIRTGSDAWESTA